MDRSLWEFSRALYAAPGVAAHCLDLQERLGADVNLLLCAAWIGATGRGRLTADRLAVLDAAARPLHHNVVRPLRAARIWLRGPSASNAPLMALRTEIKRLELVAEKSEQAELERLCDVEPSHSDPGSRLADALENIALYLERLGSAGAMIGDPLGRALRVAVTAAATPEA